MLDSETPKIGDNSIVIEEKIVDSNGLIQYKNYYKEKLLGKGGFAKCYEVTDMETNKSYAAKIVEKSSLLKGKAKQKVIIKITIVKF